MKTISIAIDGPSGAGKSSLAKWVARELHYLYVDTGALYRTIAYGVVQQGIDPKDEQAVMKALVSLDVDLRHNDDGAQTMWCNGVDVSGAIRLPEISLAAADVAAHPPVRAFLLDKQRDLARHNNVIMDGRDIASVVLPQADVKIFLTASSETRAKRRHLELEQRGTPQPLIEVLCEIEERDLQDRTRAVAPLCQAPGAVVLDTSELTFAQSAQALQRIIEERL